MGNPKGNGGEREAALLVQEWWRRLEPEAEFNRTPMSGGWRGGSDTARADLQLVGDLQTTAKRFPFCVEVKRRERWNVDRFLAGKVSPAWGWWRECLVDAAVAKKEPLLLLRRNRHPWLVIVAQDFALTRGCLTPNTMFDPNPEIFGNIHPVGYDLRRLFDRLEPEFWALR